MDRPNGKVAGSDLPMQGTKTGLTGSGGNTYGADISEAACNCLGEISASSESHAPGDVHVDHLTSTSRRQRSGAGGMGTPL